MDRIVYKALGQSVYPIQQLKHMHAAIPKNIKHRHVQRVAAENDAYFIRFS
jgi:hypothetical protein